MTVKAPVRWRDDTGWELRCDYCALKGKACWWPLTEEFWDKRHGMTRCITCQRENWRSYQASKSPEYVAAHAAKWRAYKAEWAREKRARDRRAA